MVKKNNPDLLKKELGFKLYQNRIDCISNALNVAGRDYVTLNYAKDFDWDETVRFDGHIIVSGLRHKDEEEN